MKRSALLAVAIALPVLAGAQEDMDRTGSVSPNVSAGTLTEAQVRTRLKAAGYTAIGTLALDSEGIWRTTAMKGDDMMSIAVMRNGSIEDR